MSAYIETTEPNIIYVIHSIQVHAAVHDILFTVAHKAVLLAECSIRECFLISSVECPKCS